VSFDAVLLVSFGGPEAPDEVMPFLERVTEGRGVPRERLEVVAEHYYALGGISPINEQNRHLIAALTRRLGERGVDLPVFWGNRNSPPFLADAVRSMHAAGHASALAVTTSAYPSYSGCRQYRENVAAALAQTGLADAIDIRAAGPYFERRGFAQAVADEVVGATDEARRDGLREDEVVVLFTTHSIPVAMDQGAGPDESRPSAPPGAYARAHLDVASAIMGDSTVPWRLVFQSRSGPPQVPWLEPDVNDALREEAAAGRRRVIVAPIGFISDHVEVVWDLDHEARQTAAEVGVQFVRLPTPGVHAAFVDMLVDVVVEARELPAGRVASRCSSTCCRNPEAERPVVPGLAPSE